MIINALDIINSIVQAGIIICAINYCLKNEYKRNNKYLILYTVVTSLCFIILYKIIGNSSVNILITHCISLLIPYFLFRKDILGVIVGHTIIYFAIACNSLIFNNIFFALNKLINKVEYTVILQVSLVYVPQFIMAFIILNRLDIVNKIYRTIRSKNFSIISFLILSFIVDFIGAFNIITNIEESYLFISIILWLLLIFLIFITLYFSSNNKKTKEIHNINRALEEKVFELKKIKHDYGSQISYLYALHLMKNHDRLGEALKDIIDGQNSISDKIQIKNKDHSIIAAITSSISTEDIDILIDENVEIEEFPFEEVELQRVISNIVTNSITAMDGKGRITIRTLYEFGEVVIEIKNDGPQIDKSIIHNIFKAGVSTKKDTDGNHGFGLSIVKDIIDKYSGRIEVFSDINETEFKIIMPMIVENTNTNNYNNINS